MTDHRTTATQPLKARKPRKACATTAPSKPAPARKPKPEQVASPQAGPSGKLGVIVALMRRSEGATVVAMGEATGWLAHSVRGAIAGSLKKKHGLAIISEPAEGGRVYRLATPEAD